MKNPPSYEAKRQNDSQVLLSASPVMGVEEFKQRRANFAKAMPANSIAFIPAAKEVTRSNDTEYAFCQQKSFLYLTNFNEPDALLVIITDTEMPTEKKATKDRDFQSILFSLPKDPLHEVWHGRRVGQVKAKSDYGFSKCYTLDEAYSIIPELLSGKDHVLFPFNNDKSCESEAGESFSEKIFSYLAQVRKTIRQGGLVPASLIDSDPLLNELRLHKTEAEILHMKQVNLISGLAHQRAMKETSPGKFEYQIEAELLHEFNRHGARHAAYASIVAGGDNGNILHYTANDMRLHDGDLLLIDAGGELDGYAADITRTFPVNGKFNEEQSAIYALVLNAQNAVIEAIKPNVTFAHLTILCNNILTKGLRELGILKGDLATLLEENAVKKYFIHGLGHWLGLDVHDVGDYQIENKQQNRPFKPGMVLTIEPGLYIPLMPDANDIEDKWRGIAIRIEDNILVTPTGHENLTVNTPKTIDEIELLMAETQHR